jgi:hypothetical protein
VVTASRFVRNSRYGLTGIELSVTHKADSDRCRGNELLKLSINASRLRERTLLDRRVRDTAEIPASRVRIDRRCWNRTLRPMLGALGSGLGLAPGQRLAAQLHGMLVYGPGQFFKSHQDSERVDGMVGTLVVTLPSRFTGGVIVIEHQGEVVRYRATAQPLSFIAFYADCRHEVRPVKTGYRIVLTYDLVLEGEASAATPAPGVVGALEARLREHFTTPPRSDGAAFWGCACRLRGRKSRPAGYPENPKALGERLRPGAHGPGLVAETRPHFLPPGVSRGWSTPRAVARRERGARADPGRGSPRRSRRRSWRSRGSVRCGRQ